MSQGYKKITFFVLIVAFLLVFPLAGSLVFAQTQDCNTDKQCAGFQSEQGWRGVRCVGGVPSEDPDATNEDSDATKFGRCVEAPAANIGLPDGPETAGQILDLLDLVTDWIFAIAMAVALIYLVLAGFQFVTGGGDPIKVTQARQKLIYAIIGIGVALISAGFIATLRWLIA